jgi:ABC-2 type transport system ATP-binding protein
MTGLDARNVSVRFKDRPVLSDVSFSVRGGEALAIVGENGTGKSTLLKVCAGLIAPTAGVVEVRCTLGYCPQEPGLIDLLTADEHLALFPGADRGALERLGFPSGDAARTLVRDLSGGTRQKLNLALALVGDPDVLLLDEPYQGFDRGSYLDFWGLVDEWRAAGRAAVIVTHLLAELDRLDHDDELRAQVTA